MIHLYRSGTSCVHRAPAATKLLLLAATALSMSIVPQTPVSIGLVLVAVLGLYAVARMPVSVLWREVWRLRWMVLVLGGALWLFGSAELAWISTARVVALILLAGLLTLTTPMGELLEVLRRVLRPFPRIDADAVSLTVSLTITMVPVVAGFAAEIGDAVRARGVRLGVRAVVPLMVRVLRHADDVGDALSARGLV